MLMEKLEKLVGNFNIEGTVESIKPLGEGFINDTYIVRTHGESDDYILQRKNPAIFSDVPAMMDNIDKVTSHIRIKVEAEGGNPRREVMTIVTTKDRSLCCKDESGDYWTMTVFIGDTTAYESVSSPEIAYKGGLGIGKFQAQLADFAESLFPTIKGFHDIRFRLEQWDKTIAADVAGRRKDVAAEIEWIESRRKTMLDFWHLVETGIIPLRVTHNDTKINNILFDKNGDVLCVIDLDTVMSAPALNDFGDAIRSYANTGAEDDRDLNKVSLSLPMFRAFTKGYLSQQGAVLNETEIQYLAFSAIYICYEQVLRFLMDYIAGDVYYKIKYPEHNLVRTRAQYKLLSDMEEHLDEMNGIVKQTLADLKHA